MVARAGRAVPPSMDRLTSIHIPVRSSSRARSPSKRPTVTERRQTIASSPTLARSRYLASPSATRARNSPVTRVGRASPDYHHHRRTPEPRDDLRDEAPGNEREHSSKYYEEIHGEATCDYDKGATVLYELLEASSWEKARSRCRSHPEEVRTWIVRKDRSLQVRWKLLPLHAAIIFQSPSHVVSSLLDKYPSAASRRDDQGMLPLHLAFRHKQDDEDLLETLLVQYPKAVMIKDKRDRVPLEHGRDSKFSAKLMKLYADAMVAGARLMHSSSKTGNPAGTTSETVTLNHEKQIARLEAEHEGKLAMVKAEITADNDRNIMSVKADYEDEIQKLKQSHEQRVSALVEENTKTLDDVTMEAEEERQAIISKHKEEMNELRDLLTSQVRKDRMMRDALENEVTGLHSQMKESREENEAIITKMERMKNHVTDVQELLAVVGEEQSHLQDIIMQQQEELESARTMRLDILNQLLDNEQSTGETTRLRDGEVSEVISRIKMKIDRALTRGDEFLAETENAASKARNRIELERKDVPSTTDPSFESQHEASKREGSYRMEEAQREMRRNTFDEPSGITHLGRRDTISQHAHQNPIHQVHAHHEHNHVQPVPQHSPQHVHQQSPQRSPQHNLQHASQPSPQHAAQRAASPHTHRLSHNLEGTAEQAREVQLHEAYHNVEEGIEITSAGRDEAAKNGSAPPTSKSSYDAKILGDDISAITDNTEF